MQQLDQSGTILVVTDKNVEAGWPREEWRRSAQDSGGGKRECGEEENKDISNEKMLFLRRSSVKQPDRADPG